MAPLVSFVVPVFNKAEFLAETLESIHANRYENKEVIVVDDASTDESPHIIASLGRDMDFRVVSHEVNAGLSAARNSGLREARGEYVQFWDADDIYSADGLGRLVSEMEDDRADIGTGIAVRDGRILPHYRVGSVSKRATTFSSCPDSFYSASSCFKLYRRSFLVENGLEFVPGLYMQDSEFNLRAFPLADRITVSPHVLGEYRHVEGSGARSFGPARFQSSLDIADLSRTFYMDHELEALDRVRQRHVLLFVLWGFVRRAFTLHGRTERNEELVSANWSYLDEVRHRLRDYVPGIRELSAEQPQAALAFACLLSGMVVWMPALIQGRKPMPDFEKYLASDIFTLGDAARLGGRLR